MFALGEELVGVRVLTYQSSVKAINFVLNTLEEDEVQTILGVVPIAGRSSLDGGSTKGDGGSSGYDPSTVRFLPDR